MRTLCFVFFLFLCNHSWSQYDYEAVHPDLNGEVLLSKLIEDFKPLQVLSYGQARDTMYGVIYNVQDSVRGIYTGHSLYLPKDVDPSTYLYKDGKNYGINAEHSYPQSKGAKTGNARSDMHHIFPSRIGANSSRGSIPFGENDDTDTDLWFFRNKETANIPGNSTIDLYSEYTPQRWEPRESVKGNIARAIFYFYTMYKDQADKADPYFFKEQQTTLCAWHDQDPVDELEWQRTKIIAQYQQGKANPFVLDCSLAARTYCSEISDACKKLPIHNTDITPHLSLIENPVSHTLSFQSDTHEAKLISYQISDFNGQVISQEQVDYSWKIKERIHIDIEQLPTGMYIIHWYIKINNRKQIVPFRFIKTN